MSKSTDLARLIRLARPLSQQVEAATATMLSETGLTVRMRAVLEALRTLGPATVPATGRHLGIQRQYAQVMMNEVVKANLAQRQSNPAHKRSHLYALTDGGRGVLEAIETAEARVLEQFAGPLTHSDIDTAIAVSEHVLQAFRELNKDLED